MINDQINEYSRFENLPNELFYEIASYLNSNDIYKAFSNLNSRFNGILMSIKNLHFEIRSCVDNQRLISASFVSRITSIYVPDDSDAVAIATIFPNVRSLTFHRAIRLTPKTFSTVERIKLDLSNMRPKYAIGLCSSIFSVHCLSLSSFYILHKKSLVIGHWKPLIHSIRYPCVTLTQFIFDIRPTVEWKMVEHFLKQMPHLQRLRILTLNTRTRWTLSSIAETLKIYVPSLNHLFIRLTSLGTNTLVQKDDNYHLLHPLFRHIKSKKGHSRKLSSTTIISSRII